MFEKWRIKEHMEVVSADGQHVGTVDNVEDRTIRLTRNDSPDGAHHEIDLDWVDTIDGDQVRLTAGTPLPFHGPGSETSGATATPPDEATAAAGGDPGSAATYRGTDSAANLPQDPPLFGTSGHGTGVGGSGFA